MDPNKALVLVFSRNAFYKRLHFLALAAFLLCLCVIGVLLWACVYLYQNPTQPLFFATDNVGRLIQVVPVNVPNMTKEEVIQWAEEASEAAFSFDYINYRAQIQDLQKYFTYYGWRQYFRSLVASNNILAITERKWIAIAQVVGPPKILAEGLLGGAYAWKFQMPMLVTYLQPPTYDEKTKTTNGLLVTILVQRQPVLQGYRGLGVVQIIGTSAASNQVQDISATGAQ